MPTHPPEWHTAQVRAWLLGHAVTRQRVLLHRHPQLRVQALRMMVIDAADDLPGVLTDLVDWQAVAADLGGPN